MKTSHLLLACALTFVGCGGRESVAGRDSGPELDASRDSATSNSGVVCTGPLVAPCDTTVLTSYSGCPATQPTEGESCLLTPQRECYYCTGAESSWPMQTERLMAYCNNGKWKYTSAVCGAGP